MLKIGQLTRPIFPCGEKMVWERDKQDQRRQFQWVQLTKLKFSMSSKLTQTDKFFNDKFSRALQVSSLAVVGGPPKWSSVVEANRHPRTRSSDIHKGSCEALVCNAARRPLGVFREFSGYSWRILWLQANKHPPHHLPLERNLTGGAWYCCYYVSDPSFKVAGHSGGWGVTCEDKSRDIQGKVYCYHTTHRAMDSHFNWFHSGEKCWHIRFKKQNLIDLQAKRAQVALSHFVVIGVGIITRLVCIYHRLVCIYHSM